MTLRLDSTQPDVACRGNHTQRHVRQDEVAYQPFQSSQIQHRYVDFATNLVGCVLPI